MTLLMKQDTNTEMCTIDEFDAVISYQSMSPVDRLFVAKAIHLMCFGNNINFLLRKDNGTQPAAFLYSGSDKRMIMDSNIIITDKQRLALAEELMEDESQPELATKQRVQCPF